MSATRTLVATLLLSSSVAAFACSCSNSTPIQYSVEKYREKAVFTAHVVQLMGRVYNWDGKRMSEQVLAVVKDRYWGLPWYWPKVVVLDGSYPCDIALEEGQDYLVSGRRWRYGVLGVAVCSRTQRVETAQVDLRTLDGSQCAAPGGTVIGHVYRAKESYRRNPPAPDIAMTFRDQDGKPYPLQSDADGIYELRHLPAGTYTLDSRFSSTQYLAGGFTVENGVCGEADVLLGHYVLSGNSAPGLSQYAVAELIPAMGNSEGLIRGSIESDGRFYFADVEDGDYVLTLHIEAHGATGNFYYPGTLDRKKAKLLRVANQRLAASAELSFNPGSLPIVPVPVTIDPPIDPERYWWRVRLLSSNNLDTEESWTPGEKFVFPYGVLGWPYDIQLYGFSKHPLQYGDCWSGSGARVVAARGMGITHVTIPANCQ